MTNMLLPKSLLEAITAAVNSEPLNWAVGEHSQHAMVRPRKGDTLVWLNSDEVLPKIHPEYRVTPDDKTNHIGNRMERAINHFKSGKFMDAPDVSVNLKTPDFPLFIGNGRHRVAASISLGHKWFPAHVDKEDVPHLKKLVTVKETI